LTDPAAELAISQEYALHRHCDVNIVAYAAVPCLATKL
jgi:hypothetical protein